MKIYRYEMNLVLQAINNLDKNTFRYKDIQEKVSINPMKLKFILYHQIGRKNKEVGWKNKCMDKM